MAGMWEVGWNTPIKEAEQWEFPLRDFGIDEFVMSPVSGIQNAAVKEVANMETFLDEQRAANYTIVFVDESASDNLTDFQHPLDNVVYVFGRASLSPMVAFSKPGDLKVKIPTKRNQGLLWAHQAATLIAYDRFLKDL